VSGRSELSRRIIFPAKGEVRLEPFESRVPGPSELQVRTLYSLISIGTETTILHAKYDPGTHFAARFSFPQLKTGVQAVAVVEKIGEGVDEFRSGDTIFLRMAHTSHWTLDAAQCSRVPDGIDLKSACWCGLAKTAFRAAHVAPFELGGSVLIVGAGPVGQMALRWAKAAGLFRIVVVDLSDLRLQLAGRGGATECHRGALDQLRDRLLGPSNDGFPLVVDTTGNPAVFTAALSITAKVGKLVLLGDTGYPSRQALSSDVMTKGLTIVATHDHHDRDGWTQRRIDELFFKLVRDGSFALDGLITHEFAPEACVEAYALASDRREDALGILFEWTRPAEAP
jgi:2-desacetyl-2-hydroxyethyl bacteriochlorophyllide A dehydrogenase